MSYTKARDGLARYGQVAVAAEVAYASPHRLVQMLMEGALDKIAVARGQLARRDFEGKSRNISWAVSIVNGLRNSLDHEQGGEIAANLDDLYDYMCRRLLQSNNENDLAILEEIGSLLVEIKTAWDAVPERLRHLPVPGAGLQQSVA
jgi:flagellar protein FliS